jgi:hypothetical protein
MYKWKVFFINCEVYIFLNIFYYQQALCEGYLTWLRTTDFVLSVCLSVGLIVHDNMFLLRIIKLLKAT